MLAPKQAKLKAFFDKHFPNGEVTPPEVVALATPKSSPIHKYFTWDDTEAARQHRLWEARQLIATVRVIVEFNYQPVRQYVTPVFTDSSENKKYIDISIARKSKDIWDQVLIQAMKEATLWRLRYEHLKEVTVIAESIKEVEVDLRKRGLLES